MKKIVMLILVLVMGISLAACSSDEKKSGNDADDKTIEKLSIAFVPSRDPEEIITATEPLKEMLKAELEEQGFDVDKVEITVGTNYEAVGEALSAGTTDIGLIPGGTYVLYDDGAEVILTATRAGLSLDSEDPAEWNQNKPTEKSDAQANSYRALLIAGPSEKGRALAEKVNNGDELSFEDLDNLSWNVMSSSSPAGYIYPALWLNDNFGKTITDLSKVVQADSYGSAFARLAAGQTDVLVTYADARIDFADQWKSDFGRTTDIWEETDVLGVMPAIFNDTVSVSKNSEIMNDDLKAALQKAFINIGNSDEGKEVIAIYSHDGYQNAKDSDYDNERKAQELVQELSSN